MLQTIDWIVIIGFLTLIVGVGLSFTRKGGKSLNAFFLGGRDLPWLLAGVSMVATTFAADTPLAVTELTGNSGISGNWLWWNALAGGMLTTFFFAKLWRRANILTEIEFLELRYAGKPAAFLRGFKAVYLGLFMNMLIIGWVNVALMTILEGFFGISHQSALICCGVGMLLVLAYSSLSGLLGIAVTDAIQFVIAMFGCIVLAVFVLQAPEIGGVEGLKEKLPSGALNFFPTIGGESGATASETLTIGAASFLAFFGFMWWTSWYPGAEPGGGGYVAQRMMSAKTEKDAMYATLFFQIAHYCIRPWPWIIVALCAIVLYSVPANTGAPDVKVKIEQLKSDFGFGDEVFAMNDEALAEAAQKNKDIVTQMATLKNINVRLFQEAGTNPRLQQSLDYAADKRFGYVFAMRDMLPPGFLGLLLVAFFAAYMSTISTQLNWGASYLVNDLYARFVQPGATQAHLVMVSRLATLLLMVTGFIASTFIESISDTWKFIMECGAGLGMVLILRWYWWRINAWSEISATIAPFAGFALSRYVFKLEFPDSFFATVAFTTIVWLLVTLLTQPTPMGKLQSFYERIQPQGLWQPIRNNLGKPAAKNNLLTLTICWLSAVAMTYALLVLLGKIVLLQWSEALVALVVSLAAFAVLRIFMSKNDG